MNANYDLQLTATASYQGKDIEFEFDPYNDAQNMDELHDLAVSEVESCGEWDFDHDSPDPDEVTVTISDFGEVPDKWANDKDVWEFAEAFAECDQSIEVVEAALECGISASDIDEAYQGEYDDDKDFARETADQLGAVDKTASWPMNCIDWEFAARELMYDYCSQNNHYFRNL